MEQEAFGLCIYRYSWLSEYSHWATLCLQKTYFSTVMAFFFCKSENLKFLLVSEGGTANRRVMLFVQCYFIITLIGSHRVLTLLYIN